MKGFVEAKEAPVPETEKRLKFYDDSERPGSGPEAPGGFEGLSGRYGDSERPGEEVPVEKIREKLSDEQKLKISEETGWSDKIINEIGSMEEYAIYKKAGLHEGVVDGRACLLKDIDMEYVDPMTGLTNSELMKKGRTPFDAKTGEQIELHHMGQDFDSPLAELCCNSEHGDGNDIILHDKKIESWRNDPEKKKLYNNVQRPSHWKERAEEI